MHKSAIAVGTFDGFHLGHQYLIRKMIYHAEKENLRTVIVTLDKPVRPVSGMLSTLNEKLKLLSSIAVDDIIVLPTTPDIIAQPAIDFFDKILCGQLYMRHLVIGQNFAFGFGRHGNVNWLKKTGPSKGVKVSIVKPLKNEGAVISSTLIRELISNGQIKKANDILGRPYQLNGLVQKGRGIGTKIGFPTINLKTETEKLIPQGVYVAFVGRKNDLLPALVNIGTRPTFFNEGNILIEIHLLDYMGVWSAASASVFLLNYVRPEMRFLKLNDLKEQIIKDKVFADAYFSEGNFTRSRIKV